MHRCMLCPVQGLIKPIISEFLSVGTYVPSFHFFLWVYTVQVLLSLTFPYVCSFPFPFRILFLPQSSPLESTSFSVWAAVWNKTTMA